MIHQRTEEDEWPYPGLNHVQRFIPGTCKRDIDELYSDFDEARIRAIALSADDREVRLAQWERNWTQVYVNGIVDREGRWEDTTIVLSGVSQ
jgi:hypothetical protein